MQRDVVIIGAGGAGLTAALHAHYNGSKVMLITKEYPTRSQTCMAQGGINAVLLEDDTIEKHIDDTLKAAHGLADAKMVEFLCKEAPNSIKWLDSIGVPFSRTADGKIAQRRLGGASSSRACYAQDYTGLKILHTLYDQVVGCGIEILSERFLLDIITKQDGVRGVSVLNIRSGEVEIYESSSVILATGGYSKIYDKQTTNSKSSTGDGIAVAMRCGVKCIDMEFVQFHPTAMKNSAVLISESARGEGGYLLNSKGERFTNELAPRDEVARAIDKEIKNGEDVFLDIRHLGEKFIDEELPQERKLSLLYENIDPVNELIPIKPVAHYSMGGIEVDESSQTNIAGLFAVGECANHKVHGANRLGGNSLLEIIVFGKEAGINASEYSKKNKNNFDISNEIEKQNRFLEDIRNLPSSVDFYGQKAELGRLFYEKVGIVRNQKELKNAQSDLQKIKEKISQMGVSDKSKIYNTNLVEFLEFVNMVDICEIVIKSALKREVSCGAHFVVDI